MLLDLLQSLGGFVECENEQQMNAMMVPSGMMGPLYGLLRSNRNWLMRRGVSGRDASYLVANHYMSMINDALESCEDPSRFDDLISEQTPGGINEQALSNLEQQSVFQAYEKTMDAVFDRLEGRTDGFLA